MFVVNYIPIQILVSRHVRFFFIRAITWWNRWRTGRFVPVIWLLNMPLFFRSDDFKNLYSSASSSWDLLRISGVISNKNVLHKKSKNKIKPLNSHPKTNKLTFWRYSNWSNHLSSLKQSCESRLKNLASSLLTSVIAVLLISSWST